MLLRKTKVILYVAIMNLTFMYGCKVWTTVKQTERSMRTFKNKIWRKICDGVTIDKTTESWEKRYSRNQYDMI